MDGFDLAPESLEHTKHKNNRVPGESSSPVCRTSHDIELGCDNSGSQSDFSYEDEPNMGEIPDMEGVLRKFGIRLKSLEYTGGSTGEGGEDLRRDSPNLIDSEHNPVGRDTSNNDTIDLLPDSIGSRIKTLIRGAREGNITYAQMDETE